MKTLEISGFGGGYEQTCQSMLTRALKWASEHDMNEVKYQGWEGVYGLYLAKSDAAKDLDRTMFEGLDCTGAMHQSVVIHLMFIIRRGYAEWLNGRNPESPIEIDDPEREAAVKKLEEKKQ